MGFKTKIGLVLTGVLMVAPVFADEPVNGGSVNFTGTVINAPCIVAPDSVDMKVSLGQTTVGYLDDHMRSDPVDVNIRLTNCALTGAGVSGADVTKAQITISSEAVISTGTDFYTLANTDASGAQNVGVQLFQTNGYVIIEGTPFELQLQASSTEQTLTFQAKMAAIGGIDNPPTPGRVAANATYVLSYL